MKYIDYNNLYFTSEDGINCIIPLDFNNSEYIVTGINIIESDEDELNSDEVHKIYDTYNISFCSRQNKPKLNLYCVPCLQVFAFDDEGVYGTIHSFDKDFLNSDIYYIDLKKNVYYLAKNIETFSTMLINKSYDKSNLIISKNITVFNDYFEALKTVNIELCGIGNDSPS